MFCALIRHNVIIAYIVLAATVASSFPASAETDFEADLSQIESAIVEAREIADEGKGLVSDIAAVRIETLLLSKALLENRKLAEEGGPVNFVEMPVNEIDTTKADAILADINRSIADIQKTEDEVDASGGLTQVLALTRLETERLTLAQLKLAYYQAAYGIALPSVQSRSSKDATALTVPDTDPEESQVAWADPQYPDIDYSLPVFQRAHADGALIAGWWTISETRAAIDDSPTVVSTNLSLYQRRPSWGGNEQLLLQCQEGESAVGYRPGSSLVGSFGGSALDVSIRLDDDPARKAKWNQLTDNKGIGLFGAKAEAFMRTMYKRSKVFLRLHDRRKTYDSLFDVAGVSRAIDAVAEACGWTPIELTQNDYKAIQSILKTAGYSIGVVDGIWGPSSRKAMKSFQKAAGLRESGAPSPESLKQLGYEPSPAQPGDAEQARKAQEEQLAAEARAEEETAEEGRLARANSEENKGVRPQEQQELAQKRNRYFSAIRQQVERRWRKPPGTAGDVDCSVELTQSAGGEVLQVTSVQCVGGGDALQKSVVNAVIAASPLPQAPDRALFDRRVKFFFRPGG